ncbi:hypothetical protein CROQUDRAFT_229597 [Cronartium quercuum f. sp. fusiforme G11]|uniref:Uncharacterized protein n=1 Tax=Cronartium quercuum f. sp. fusiforme G11 TaxID=708437 RepID=A0A9P6NVB1_9BASI|nr:hypothetical protein CROQUDRAFT_229597 [Cronartium quercuum f. sp. fusiforme G11]
MHTMPCFFTSFSLTYILFLVHNLPLFSRKSLLWRLGRPSIREDARRDCSYTITYWIRTVVDSAVC